VIDEKLAMIDVMPTLLGLAGIEPEPEIVDGVDASALLKGEVGEWPDRDLFFYIGISGADDEWVAMHSGDGYKLVVRGTDIRDYEVPDPDLHRVSLFDIEADPIERKNLAAVQPDRVKEMYAALSAFRALQPDDAIPLASAEDNDFVPPALWRNPINAEK